MQAYTARTANSSAGSAALTQRIEAEVKEKLSSDSRPALKPAALESKRSPKPAAPSTDAQPVLVAPPGQSTAQFRELTANTELTAALFVKLCQENPLLHEKFPSLCGSALPLPLRQYIWKLTLLNDDAKAKCGPQLCLSFAHLHVCQALAEQYCVPNTGISQTTPNHQSTGAASFSYCSTLILGLCRCAV